MSAGTQQGVSFQLVGMFPVTHRVCMGSQQDEGQLLQPVLIPSDASEKKEQDEGSGGSGKKDAHRRLACVA